MIVAKTKRGMAQTNHAALHAKIGHLERVLGVPAVDNNMAVIVTSQLREMAQHTVDQPKDKNGYTYAWRIVHELTATLATTPVSNRTVDEVLIALNFNARTYFANYLSRLAARLTLEDSLTTKLEKLLFEYKQVNQIPSEAGLQYTGSYPPLKEIIANWVNEEIAYLDKLRELSQAGSTVPGLLNFKLLFDLSVAQFSCLVKGFKESGVMLNANVTEMGSFFSKVVVTKRSENISERSFQRKYYNIEDNTRLKVIERLDQVIDWLKKLT